METNNIYAPLLTITPEDVEIYNSKIEDLLNSEILIDEQTKKAVSYIYLKLHYLENGLKKLNDKI